MEEKLLLNLGKRIARLRKERGLNQEEFAALSGKMINTISNIERGLCDPKMTTLLAIAEALDIPFSSLLSEKLPKDEAPVTLKNISALLKNRDEKTLSVVQKQIEALLELP